ncbi:hypothetical protein [Streptomyces lavendulae]|uniref:hypothetical protein n=1 Tax=Streptomyces lavendulae TaxID=1914 RepID=UPI0033C80CBA
MPDALDAEADADAPSGAQVVNEGGDGLAEALALFWGEAAQVVVEAGHGLVGRHVGPPGSKKPPVAPGAEDG